MKRLLSFLVLVVLVFAPSSVLAATFSDVRGDFWANVEIYELSDRGVMNGYPDGTFKPNNPVLRIQAASMIVNLLGLEQQDEELPEFNDISDHFAQKEVVDIMVETGIMRGSNGNFRPYEPVTRAQMASILTRAFNLERNEDLYFYDIQPDYWNFADINALAESGITGGRNSQNSIFDPSSVTTRAQFVTFLYRAIDESGRTTVRPKAGDYGRYVHYEGLLYGVKDATSIHALQRKDNGEYEEVEVFHLEDSEIYKEAGENEQQQMAFFENLQIYGPWNRSINLGSPPLPKPKLVTGAIQVGDEVRKFRLLDGKIESHSDGYFQPSYKHLYVIYYLEDSVLQMYGEDITDFRWKIDENVSKAEYSGSTIVYQKGNNIKSIEVGYGERKTIYSGEIIDFNVFEGKVIIVTPEGYRVTNLSGRLLEEVAYSNSSNLRTHGVVFEETPAEMRIMVGNVEETIGVLKR